MLRRVLQQVEAAGKICISGLMRSAHECPAIYYKQQSAGEKKKRKILWIFKKWVKMTTSSCQRAPLSSIHSARHGSPPPPGRQFIDGQIVGDVLRLKGFFQSWARSLKLWGEKKEEEKKEKSLLFFFCFSWATSFRDVIQRSLFWKHWPSRNFLWLMLPARSPLRESKTFFAYSHHRALLTTLHSFSRYCTSHLALPLRLSGSTQFLFCCYGNRPTVGIPIANHCFLFLLMPAVRQAINSAFSLTGNAWEMETHMGVRAIKWISMRWSGWEEGWCPGYKRMSNKGGCCLFLLNNSYNKSWISQMKVIQKLTWLTYTPMLHLYDNIYDRKGGPEDPMQILHTWGTTTSKKNCIIATLKSVIIGGGQSCWLLANVPRLLTHPGLT